MISRIPTSLVAWLVMISATSLAFGQVEPEFKRDASEPMLRTSVLPGTVQVAEPFVLKIEVEVDADTQVAFDEPPTTLGPLSVLDVQDEFDLPAVDSPKRRLFIRRITLDSLKSGDISIPSMPIGIGNASQSVTWSSQPVSITVVSEWPSDSDQPLSIRDILPSIQLESDRQSSSLLSMRNLLMGAAATLVITLAGLVWWFNRPVANKNSNFKTAKQRVARIASGLGPNSNPSEVFQQIEDNLRKLIELESPIAATKLSNEELLDQLETIRFDVEPLKQLREVLTASERVRFAKVKMGLGELQNAIQQALQWIDAFSKSQQQEQS